jgi:hypothetical protein
VRSRLRAPDDGGDGDGEGEGVLSNGRAVSDVNAQMDDAKVLQACHLLHEALCGDLELKRLSVQVDRDCVSLTIHEKRGTQESRLIIGEHSTPHDIHPLNERR